GAIVQATQRFRAAGHEPTRGGAVSGFLHYSGLSCFDTSSERRTIDRLVRAGVVSIAMTRTAKAREKNNDNVSATGPYRGRPAWAACRRCEWGSVRVSPR